MFLSPSLDSLESNPSRRVHEVNTDLSNVKLSLGASGIGHDSHDIATL